MPALMRLSLIISRWWVLLFCLLGIAWPGAPLVWAQTTVVIDEDFSDDDGGCGWKGNYGCVPKNTGKAGQWLSSGHVVSGGNADDDWRPLVQSNVAQPAGGSGTPSLDYFASLNRTGADTGQIGVFNMDGIIKFQTAGGVNYPAVTGSKIVGSFWVYRQTGNFGFGFTDDIAELQAFQATMPEWKAGGSPIMMPTPYSTGDWENPASNANYDSAYRGFSPNVTGHISFNNGANQVYTNAPVDMNNDGITDFGRAAPKTDPNNSVGRLNASTPSQVRFEYTVGNSEYDLLQIDQGSGFEDIVQCNSAACQDTGGSPTVPNPGGPMPVGHVLSSIEGMFITGGNYQLTEIWADDFMVEVVVDPTSLGWNKSEGGSWHETDSWNPQAVPTSGDSVTFGRSVQGGTVFFDEDVSVQKMVFDSPHDYAISGTGKLTLQADSGTAEIEVAGGAQGDHQLQVDLISLGSDTNVNVSTGASLDFNGQIDLNNRSLTIESGTVNINNKATASTTGNVFNSGTIGGGGTINGHLLNAGTIAVEFLDESTPNGLNINGSAFLNGTLDVVGDITPTAGLYQVLTASSLIDSGLSLAPAVDEFFDIVVTASSVLLVPSSDSLPGDYNENGTVDAADYTVFRDSLFSGVALPNDNNLGTPIGIGHYNLWKASFGNTADSAAAAVPEPATVGLLLLTPAVLAFRRFRWN